MSFVRLPCPFQTCEIEYIARAISDYLTSETGIMIIFESAIVPKWKDSRIAFKNVYISRRHPSLENAPDPLDSNAGHRAASRYDIGNHPVSHVFDDDHSPSIPADEVEKIDYALFDLNVDSIDVTLSLWRWLDGKGLVKDARVKGVRGIFGMSYSAHATQNSHRMQIVDSFTGIRRSL